jgi:hypothetical protein
MSMEKAVRHTVVGAIWVALESTVVEGIKIVFLLIGLVRCVVPGLSGRMVKRE